MANLHLDEVTGERVSKSELKKRQKLRMKEEEKRKKEAAAPPKPAAAKKTNAEADEKDLNPNVSLSTNFQVLRAVKLNVSTAIFRDPVTRY